MNLIELVVVENALGFMLQPSLRGIVRSVGMTTGILTGVL
jgi:hypothetical protein